MFKRNKVIGKAVIEYRGDLEFFGNSPEGVAVLDLVNTVAAGLLDTVFAFDLLQ